MKGSRFSKAYFHYEKLLKETTDRTLKFNVLLKLIRLRYIHTKTLDHSFDFPEDLTIDNLKPKDCIISDLKVQMLNYHISTYHLRRIK